LTFKVSNNDNEYRKERKANRERARKNQECCGQPKVVWVWKYREECRKAQSVWEQNVLRGWGWGKGGGKGREQGEEKCREGRALLT
jgi:hypothetical protein